MRVTQKQVLEEAVGFLSRPGGFTSSAYFYPESDDGVALTKPGEGVYAACAIGGVEQALWKLTGETVARRERELLAQEEGGSGAVRDDQIVRLYAGVMKRLNRVARRLYPFDLAAEDEDGPVPIRTVEQVTFMDCTELARKRRTLKVFRTALAELDR